MTTEIIVDNNKLGLWYFGLVAIWVVCEQLRLDLNKNQYCANTGVTPDGGV